MKKQLLDEVYERILNNLNNGTNIIGIHGPQGMGKTTINKFLKSELTKKGYKVIILSIDDFYYDYTTMKIKLDNFNDDLYKYRGLAGTHDLTLLDTTLKNLIENKNTKIPIFNKNKRHGFGDRDGYYESGINNNIIILEGWLIGYEPLSFINDNLKTFNDNLKTYDKIKEKITYWIKVEANSLDYIYNWRWSAEDKNNGMDKETFNNFFKPYLVIYKNYKINDLDKININEKREVIN